jgi:hypothetical protein
MDFAPLVSSGRAPFFYMGIVILWTLFITGFWMVVGWRAMRAHEELVREMRRMRGGGESVPTR